MKNKNVIIASVIGLFIVGVGIYFVWRNRTKKIINNGGNNNSGNNTLILHSVVVSNVDYVAKTADVVISSGNQSNSFKADVNKNNQVVTNNGFVHSTLANDNPDIINVTIRQETADGSDGPIIKQTDINYITKQITVIK